MKGQVLIPQARRKRLQPQRAVFLEKVVFQGKVVFLEQVALSRNGAGKNSYSRKSQGKLVRFSEASEEYFSKNPYKFRIFRFFISTILNLM